MTTPNHPRHLLDVTLDEFTEWCTSRGLPGFRAKQVFEWVYDKQVADFEAMTNLSKDLRRQLAGEWVVLSSEITRRQVASDGTTKLLLRWPDGATSECVMIPDGRRKTGCISSQVGCPVGCTFCASGLQGLERQLTAGQIVEQVWRIHEMLGPSNDGESAPTADEMPESTEDVADDFDLSEFENIDLDSEKDSGGLASFLEGDEDEARSATRRSERDRSEDPEKEGKPAAAAPGTRAEGDKAERLSNLVFMGLGEPLANFASVTRAIAILNADWGIHLGARRITVSTIGLPKQIRKLAELELQINLAISLHAPNDKLRRELIPWAERISIDELIEAGRHYFDKTGREVTLEYVLLGGVNDRLEHANDLVRVCRKMRCNVNLLRYNPVPTLPYKRPSSSDTYHFVARLRERGVNAHVRKSRGLDIDAACGQLRRRHQQAQRVQLKPRAE